MNKPTLPPQVANAIDYISRTPYIKYNLELIEEWAQPRTKAASDNMHKFCKIIWDWLSEVSVTDPVRLKMYFSALVNGHAGHVEREITRDKILGILDKQDKTIQTLHDELFDMAYELRKLVVKNIDSFGG